MSKGFYLTIYWLGFIIFSWIAFKKKLNGIFRWMLFYYVLPFIALPIILFKKNNVSRKHGTFPHESDELLENRVLLYMLNKIMCSDQKLEQNEKEVFNRSRELVNMSDKEIKCFIERPDNFNFQIPHDKVVQQRHIMTYLNMLLVDSNLTEAALSLWIKEFIELGYSDIVVSNSLDLYFKEMEHHKCADYYTGMLYEKHLNDLKLAEDAQNADDTNSNGKFAVAAAAATAGFAAGAIAAKASQKNTTKPIDPWVEYKTKSGPNGYLRRKTKNHKSCATCNHWSGLRKLDVNNIWLDYFEYEKAGCLAIPGHPAKRADSSCPKWTLYNSFK